MLEIVAGVDDDGQPVAAAGARARATAWRRRCRRTAQHSWRGPAPLIGTGPRALGRTSAEAGLAAARPVEAAHQRGGPAFGGFAHDQHGRGRNRIGKAYLGDLQRAAGQVLLAAPIQSAGTPAAPMASPTVPSRQARPALSVMITPMSAWKCASMPLLDAPRAGIGVLAAAAARAGRDPRPRGWTDRCRHWPARGRAAWRRSARWAWRAAPPRTRDRMASTRCGSLLRRPPPALWRRATGLDRRQIEIAALGLGDDLLGDGQDVADCAARWRSAPAPRSAGRKDRRPGAPAACRRAA